MSTRITAVVARALGVKNIFMVVNNMAIPYSSLYRVLAKKFDDKVVDSVDLFITGSDAASTQLGKVLNVPKSKRRVLYNAIETARFNRYLAKTSQKHLEEKIIFSSIGILEERKGYRILLQAVDKILRTRPEYKNTFDVRIEGVGPLYNDLSDYIKMNNLSDHVSLLGKSSDIGKIYNECDVFVLPSTAQEDLPNVISEAMLFSKPVIASRIAGIPQQVIDGLNGYLVDPSSVNQLVDALISCLEDREQLPYMGKQGHKRFNEHFSVYSALTKYNKLFVQGDCFV